MDSEDFITVKEMLSLHDKLPNTNLSSKEVRFISGLISLRIKLVMNNMKDKSNEN